ncbi:hypothetical protein PUN28_016941 [Cardiocondyla obscurior]|uniref:Uncharacterized protein n=1 Tax=Cardiocondyla obscurior TaxID=286306 RepID=A0AAW2EJM5_9HYME
MRMIIIMYVCVYVYTFIKLNYLCLCTTLKEIQAPIVAPCIVIIALQMLMSSYYIFNMEYPTSSSCTLEFVQKYFLNIYPATGTKSRKIANKYKVLSLFNKLRDVDNI